MKRVNNLSPFEARLRLLTGILMLVLAYPLFTWEWPAWLLLIAGGLAVLTGVSSYCPAYKLVFKQKGGEYAD